MITGRPLAEVRWCAGRRWPCSTRSRTGTSSPPAGSGPRQFMAGLSALPGVAEVRGRGLLFAVRARRRPRRPGDRSGTGRRPGRQRRPPRCRPLRPATHHHRRRGGYGGGAVRWRSLDGRRQTADGRRRTEDGRFFRPASSRGGVAVGLGEDFEIVGHLGGRRCRSHLQSVATSPNRRVSAGFHRPIRQLLALPVITIVVSLMIGLVVSAAAAVVAGAGRCLPIRLHRRYGGDCEQCGDAWDSDVVPPEQLRATRRRMVVIRICV